MPRDLPERPAPPPRHPAGPATPPPPPLTTASPNPPSLARALPAPRAVRKGDGDRSAAPSCPRGPEAATASAAAPRGINPGSVGGSGGCPHPSPPPQSPRPPPPPPEAALLPATPTLGGPGLERQRGSSITLWK
ncbi:uncharacterized protein [Symphalangus syndactylus]|uniref:uncharacterized protein n=1 Tax=Symphalangus syndactylus TaxID=9590 RepID=UPI00300649D7